MEGLETSSAQFFGVHCGAQLANSLTQDTETGPLASFLRHGGDLWPAICVFEEKAFSWNRQASNDK